MKISAHLGRLLRAITQSLNVQAGCALTGVEPEWLALCDERPYVKTARICGPADVDAALFYAKAL